MPVVSTDQQQRHQEQLQTPDSAARNGFRLRGGLAFRFALGLAAGLLDRDGARLRLAALGTFAALPRRGPSTSAAVPARLRRRRSVRSQRIPCRARRLPRPVRHRPLGHHHTPGRPGALRLARTCSAVTISGASMVTSPAPMVTTTSPGPADSATASATEEKSRQVLHRDARRARRRWLRSPPRWAARGRRRRRARKLGRQRRAPGRIRQRKAFVREYKCGWNTTSERPAPVCSSSVRTASSVALISVG